MRLARTAPVKVLEDRDLPEALAVLERDAVANVFVAARVRAAGLDPARLGAQVWGYVREGRLESLCYAGANLVPVAATPEALDAFADRARRQGRRCSSIVGPAPQVASLWAQLRPHWGTPRAVRERQPVMAMGVPPAVPGDPLVRRVLPGELDVVLPACVAMFTEEVGVSPVVGEGATLYRARVSDLIRQGRAFARIDDGQVVFKAEVGAVTAQACQLQGVWVAPHLRGRGLAAPGIATVVEESLRSLAPTVSLYVNGYNTRARSAYRRVGFTEVDTFMSVLF